MHPSLQPAVRMQLALASHWENFCQTPHLRLCRWLTADADEPLLRDYLHGLSEASGAVLRPEKVETGNWAVLEAQLANAPVPVVWLAALPGDAEVWLRAQLVRGTEQRFIILEDEVKQPLQRLARWFPTAVHTAMPDVSMARLLATISAEAEVAHPEGRFQRQFQLLSAALAQNEKLAIARLAADCLATCQTQAWPLLESAVWSSTAQHALRHNRPDDALSHFAAALHCSEKAFGTGNVAAGTLSIQAWLGLAATWQQRRRTKQAIQELTQAVARAEALGAGHLGVEAARQLGHALGQTGQAQAEVTAYQRALTFAEQLPPGQRPHAAIEAVGEAYLKRLHTAPDRQALRTRLRALVI